MKTPPKTSLNNQTLEEDIQLILDRMHHKIVHNETLKIDPPHKIDKTCPYKCTRDATKAIQELFTRECEKANRLADTYARIIARVYDGEKVEVADREEMNKLKEGK